jgi:excisionase family DNA binding protein
MQTEWLTAAEAANYLKTEPRSLLRWVRNGQVPAYSLSGSKRHVWRFRREDLDGALLANRVLTSESRIVLSRG